MIVCHEINNFTIIGVNIAVIIVVLMALAPLRPVGGAESQLRLLLFLFENFLFNQRLQRHPAGYESEPFGRLIFMSNRRFQSENLIKFIFTIVDSTILSTMKYSVRIDVHIQKFRINHILVRYVHAHVYCFHFE